MESYSHLTTYCSSCNDPKGSAESCTGESLEDYGPWEVCAIPHAKASKKLGGKVRVTTAKRVVTLTVKDHCGTAGCIDVWMGMAGKCKCNIKEKITKVEWL